MPFKLILFANLFGVIACATNLLSRYVYVNGYEWYTRPLSEMFSVMTLVCLCISGVCIIIYFVNILENIKHNSED